MILTKPSIFLVAPDQASEVDMTREPNTRGCERCGAPIGVVQDANGQAGWVDFYELMAPGDTEPTRLDKDCLAWLQDMKPAL